MDASFLVVGIARDCQKTIGKTISAITGLLPPSSPTDFFIVESDSKDGTVEEITRLQIANPNLGFASLGALSSKIPDRILRIVECRNAYMSYIDEQLASGKHYDYVVVADLDGVNLKVRSRRPLSELLSLSRVICSSQRGRYYDILALRKEGWVDKDWRLAIRFEVSQGIDRLTSYLKNVSRKQIRLKWTMSNITVESAYGGLAVYPLEAIAGLRYSAEKLTSDIYECEHVALNLEVRNRGYVVEIAPSLKNSGSLAHSLLAYQPLRFLAFTFGSLRQILNTLWTRIGKHR
jgi:hypothetical protein